MKEVMSMIQEINKTMRGFGFTEELCLGNDNCTITESEVVMKIPFSLTVKIPKKDFDGQSDTAISHAVSQAISQVASLNK